ncbi:RcpB [Pasteurella canis]|uniref:RcpB n=1 Tax=Pasteurella canis TaxID=753 RepID=UPI001CBD9CC4|nr:RcpB [Pasteurella canis]
MIRNIIISLFLCVMLLPNSAIAFSENELSKDINVTNPVQSKNFYHTRLISRHVFTDYSDMTYRRVSHDVIRDIGSDKSKTINIIWTDKTSKTIAIKLQKMLVGKGIESKKVKVLQSKYKRPVYPLYIEIERVGAKAATCRNQTAENFLGNPYIPCATNSNSRIHLKY